MLFVPYDEHTLDTSDSNLKFLIRLKCVPQSVTQEVYAKRRDTDN